MGCRQFYQIPGTQSSPLLYILYILAFHCCSCALRYMGVLDADSGAQAMYLPGPERRSGWIRFS